MAGGVSAVVQGAPARKTDTEVDFCDRLREWAERQGFDVYPEVHGWDLVFVSAERRTLDRFNIIEPGQQVGIHAKMRASFEVVEQALPPPPDGIGWHYPTFPMVAVPSAGGAFARICAHLGIGVIVGELPRRKWQTWGGKREARAQRRQEDPRVSRWPKAQGYEPLLLPPIASRTIVAGSPSPRVLSDWRVRALRFLAFARGVESWSTADLDRFGVGRSWADRWGEYIDTRSEVRRGRKVRVHFYRLTDRADRLPDAGYKDVAAELLAKDAETAA